MECKVDAGDAVALKCIKLNFDDAKMQRDDTLLYLQRRKKDKINVFLNAYVYNM
jgi:hypothetical protein